MSTDTLDKPAVDIAVDLEAMFKQEIPCHSCSRPAEYRSFGHDSGDCGRASDGKPPPWFKCSPCYLKWRRVIDQAIRDQGYVKCAGCKRRFPTAEKFSNWRRF